MASRWHWQSAPVDTRNKTVYRAQTGKPKAEAPSRRGWPRTLVGLLRFSVACTLIFAFWFSWPSPASAPISEAWFNGGHTAANDNAITEVTKTEVTEAEVAAENEPVAEVDASTETESVVETDANAETGPVIEDAATQEFNIERELDLEIAVVSDLSDSPDLQEIAAPEAADPLQNPSLVGADSELLNKPPLVLGYTTIPSATATAPARDASQIQAEVRSLLAQIDTNSQNDSGEDASATESRTTGSLVPVEVQVQPNRESSPLETPTPTPAAQNSDATPAISHPYALVLGSLWESFTPLPAAEIDHYWLQSPFSPSYNQGYSVNYQFGSTAGGRYRPHHGVDISNPAGTPVLAMAAGEVVHAGPDNPALLGPYNNFYGNTVVLRLDRRLSLPDGEKDVFLLYGHLSEVLTVRGAQVAQGEPVGTVGMTGIAIGPHLHVEVRVGQNSYMTAVNPALWMRPLPGTGTVAVRMLNAEGRTWAGAKVSLLRYEADGARWVRTIETYRSEVRLLGDPVWGENGAMSNLPAGSYFITAEINGEKVGQNILVNPGETTFVELRTEQ
jgi:murein DD-endopeptidase MepM/ murein hydrolase activator NlpD